MISKEKYAFLRKDCTKGEKTQNQVYHDFGIVIDRENMIDYLKYLINLSVANRFTQLKVFEILHNIPCDDATGKLLMILSNNILADSKDLIQGFLLNNLAIVNFCIDSSLSSDAEVFEWSYYLLTKFHTGSVTILHSTLTAERFRVLVDFLNTRLEKAWETSEKLVPSLISFKDLRTFCSVYSGAEESLTVLINYCSRELAEKNQICGILLETGALIKVYEKLENCEKEGIKGVLLQIIANTVCSENVEILTRYISVVVKAAELDINEPTNREWVFVIIRNAIPLSSDFHEKLQQMYDQSSGLEHLKATLNKSV